MFEENEVALDLKTKTKKVKWILENFTETRKDDYNFFWEYTRQFTNGIIVKPNTNEQEWLIVDYISFRTLDILNHSLLAIRQTLQKKYPELRDEATWNKRHHRGKKFETEILKVN